MKNYKEQILELRKQGLSYQAIQRIVKCSKGTISKYCSNDDTAKRIQPKFTEEEIKVVKEYFNTHTTKETAKYFNTSHSTIKNYCGSKNKIITKTYDDYLLRHKLHKRKKRIETKQKCVDYKGGKCIVCGYNKCLKALDFHHTNPEEKDFTIAQNNTSFTFEKLKTELDKCVLVCNRCHTEIHEKLIDINDYLI
jgi:intein-encoded DNA endonuclease-like protein